VNKLKKIITINKHQVIIDSNLHNWHVAAATVGARYAVRLLVQLVAATIAATDAAITACSRCVNEQHSADQD